MPTRTSKVYVVVKAIPDRAYPNIVHSEILGVFKSKQSADMVLFKEYDRMKKAWLKPFSKWQMHALDPVIDKIFQARLSEQGIKFDVLQQTLKP